MGDVAIYHPSINLPRNDWLQLSLLYWERLLRVVPKDYSRPAPRHVEELEAADLVRSWDPAPAHRDASALFLSALTSHREELCSVYRLSTGSAWRGVTDQPWEADPGLTYVHAGKLTPELSEELVRSELAVWDPDGWIGVHPRIGRTYMAVLVEQVGRESCADPITDDPIAHILSGDWSAGKIVAALTSPVFPQHESVDNSRLAASLALISVRTVVPARPLRTEEIVEIRASLGSELWRFREFVVTVITEAGLEATRPEALQMHLEDLYRARIAPEVARLQHDLGLFKVETVQAAINIRTTLPPALAMATAQAGFHDPVLSTGAAIAASVFGLRQEILSERKAALEANPAAFLWGVGDRLGDMKQINAALQTAAKLWSQRP